MCRIGVNGHLVMSKNRRGGRGTGAKYGKELMDTIGVKSSVTRIKSLAAQGPADQAWEGSMARFQCVAQHED